MLHFSHFHWYLWHLCQIVLRVNRQSWGQIQSHTCQADNAECARAPRLSVSPPALRGFCLMFSKSQAALRYLTSRPPCSFINIHSSFLGSLYLYTGDVILKHEKQIHPSLVPSFECGEKREDLPQLQRPSLYLSDPQPATCPATCRLPDSSKNFFLTADSHTEPCTNFARRVFSLSLSVCLSVPGPLTCAEQKFFLGCS